jgi:hypothetical protein
LSDQDFFFEDEEDDAEKTASKKPAAKGASSASKSSPKPAGRPAAKSSPAKAAPAKAAAPQQEQGGFLAQQVSMTVVGLIAVIALLVGVIGGYVLGGASQPPQEAAAPATQQAPTLTQEQINAGQLPAGHPSISGGAASGAATGSKTATPAGK